MLKMTRDRQRKLLLFQAVLAFVIQLLLKHPGSDDNCPSCHSHSSNNEDPAEDFNPSETHIDFSPELEVIGNQLPSLKETNKVPFYIQGSRYPSTRLRCGFCPVIPGFHRLSLLCCVSREYLLSQRMTLQTSNWHQKEHLSGPLCCSVCD